MTDPNPDALIAFSDLAYTYQDGTRALAGVSGTIAAGESVAVVGGNGAGKSTLLMLLCGGYEATGGELRIGGVVVRKATLAMIRQRIGMVFQDSDDQLFMPTVWDDVAFGPLNQGLPDDEVDRVVAAALAEAGVADLAGKAPYRLSGGQKRLVAIATVLAMRPEVVVLDEPTSNLDPKARRAFIATINRLGRTTVIASHDLEMVLATCRRTIAMAGGRILADGPTASVLADERVMEQAHLEVPVSLGRPDAADRR